MARFRKGKSGSRDKDAEVIQDPVLVEEIGIESGIGDQGEDLSVLRD